jgi:hypothetical protein
MALKKFYLSGEPEESAVEIEVTESMDIDGLNNSIAAQYSIVQLSGTSSAII